MLNRASSMSCRNCLNTLSRRCGERKTHLRIWKESFTLTMSAPTFSLPCIVSDSRLLRRSSCLDCQPSRSSSSTAESDCGLSGGGVAAHVPFCVRLVEQSVERTTSASRAQAVKRPAAAALAAGGGESPAVAGRPR